MAYLLQYWDWLEDKRSEDDEVFRRVWKAVKTEVREVRVAKTERKRKKRREEKEIKKKEQKEETEKKKKKKPKKEEDNGSEEGGRGIRDMG